MNKRWSKGTAIFLSSASLMVLMGCAGEAIETAKYEPDQCQRVALIDSESGIPIRGAEDFAVDPMSGRIFVSAYDRRAVEKAARKRVRALPQGGVYAVNLEAIFDNSSDEFSVTSLINAGDVAGGLRPHGLTFDPTHQELVFVNRGYQRIHNKWKMSPSLQRIGVNGEIYVGESQTSSCAANDVLVTDHHVFTSFDHGSCGWRAGFEDVFNLKRSGISSNHNGAVFSRAAFANGLARTPKGDVVLSATREKALIVLREISDGVEERLRISLPGGPDNLSISFDGGVIAAIHPSMLRLALNRKLGIGKAPSRLIKVDADHGSTEILFDDPTGKLFSAATIGVETPRGLIVGSVTDEGLLVCRTE